MSQGYLRCSVRACVRWVGLVSILARLIWLELLVDCFSLILSIPLRHPTETSCISRTLRLCLITSRRLLIVPVGPKHVTQSDQPPGIQGLLLFFCNAFHTTVDVQRAFHCFSLTTRQPGAGKKDGFW